MSKGKEYNSEQVDAHTLVKIREEGATMSKRQRAEE
jgi:hypothetical protein